MFTNGHDYEPNKYKSEIRAIVMEETAQLGQSHPLVLDSLVRVFAVELALQDKAADDTADQLLRQLRQPQILEQRLMTSLQVEETVATLYCDIAQYEQGLPIFGSLQERLMTPKLLGEVMDVEEELKTFRKRVEESFQQFRDSAESLLNDEMKRGQNEPAESAYRRAASLSRALYGENHQKTVKTCFSLAKFLYDSPDSQKRPEGLRIVIDLLVGREWAKAKTEGSQLWEGHTDEVPQVPAAELGEKVRGDNHHESENEHEDTLEKLYQVLQKFKEEHLPLWENEGSEGILDASDREEAEDTPQYASEEGKGKQPEEATTR
jgi:hypothetical protein